MSILCAVDGNNIPDRVVMVGHDLAMNYSTDLVVLHVMPQERFDTLSAERVDYYMDDATANAAETAQSVTTGTLDDLDEFIARGRIGEPTEEVLKEADRVDAKFLVIGGRKRTPVGKAIFGSTTQALLLNSENPVVTVMNEN